MTLNLREFPWPITTFPYPLDGCSVGEVQCDCVFSDRELTERQITDILIEAKRVLIPGCYIYVTTGPWDWLTQTLKTLGFEDVICSTYATSANKPRTI